MKRPLFYFLYWFSSLVFAQGDKVLAFCFFRSRTWQWRLLGPIRIASLVQDLPMGTRTGSMLILIWAQIQQGSTGPTAEPGARIQPQGCGGRKWKLGWKGFPVGKEHQHQWVDVPSQWCSWRRRMSQRSGLHKWSLVCLLPLFHCLRVGMIWSGYGSGTAPFLSCVLEIEQGFNFVGVVSKSHALFVMW